MSYEDDLFAMRVAPRAMEAAPDAFVIIDRAGEIRAVNAATVRLTGWPRKELVHQKIEMLVPLELRQHHQASREQYMMQPMDRPMGQGLRLELLHRNGTRVPVEILLGVLESDDLYVIATIRRTGPE